MLSVGPFPWTLPGPPPLQPQLLLICCLCWVLDKSTHQSTSPLDAMIFEEDSITLKEFEPSSVAQWLELWPVD